MSNPFWRSQRTLPSYGQPLALYENQGDGTFVERGKASGLAAPDTVWESCLTALDYDRIEKALAAPPRTDFAPTLATFEVFKKGGSTRGLYEWAGPAKTREQVGKKDDERLRWTYAMKDGSTEMDAYLEGWRRGPVEERAGTPEEVMNTLVGTPRCWPSCCSLRRRWYASHPSMYSIARYGSPSSLAPAPKTVTTFSCSTAAWSAASRPNIVRPSGSPTKCGKSRLTTKRCGSARGSTGRARYTSAVPPTAIRDSSQ